MRNVKKTTTLALAALIVSATGALAAEGVATGSVNVRTGPGTSYNKVDTLYAGEQVEIGQCQSGWCYVEHTGADGWVSANFLAPAGSGSGSGGSGDDCHVNWVIGQGFTLECNGNSITVPGPGSFPPVTAEVCFYDGFNYTGSKVCGPPGTSKPNITGFWNNRISSIKINGGAHATICDLPFGGGFCYTHSASIAHLSALNNKTSSFQIY